MAVDPVNQLRQIALHVVGIQRVIDVLQFSTQLIFPFHQIGLEPGLGQSQSGGHPGQPTADDQATRSDGLEEPGQRRKAARSGHRHPHQIHSLFRGSVRFVHVHPGALIANIGHLEQVAVQPGLLKGLLEQRFVRARRTGRDNDPVQAMRLDLLSDPVLGILRARVHVRFRIHHVGQGHRIVCHVGRSHHAADVEPTGADKHAHARRLAPDVALWRIHLVFHQRAPGRSQYPARHGCRAASLHHGLRHILGRSECTTDKDPRSGRPQGR